ncbi:MAG: hypothetical protein HZA04_01215 [Nitrospinae bacterium]|nr:hypothetical protein [Nitrospinota bacterium]
MSAKRVERLQGTDGVRRPVGRAADFRNGPLDAFLTHGVMTEEFFELYCYAHVRGLIEDGKMAEGDDVLIGWDSRDTGGFYTERAVDGIAKAGGRPLVLGALPTPGVAMALACMEAATAFMITASHNPKDQNGIKIFLGPHGAKFMPDDDLRLTKRIYQTACETVRRAERKFEPFDGGKSERRRFIDFHAEPENTWLPPGDTLFARTVLVADPAHGALAGIAAGVLSQLGFARVIEVAEEQNGEVNRDSGVAFLEGMREIAAAEFDCGAGISRHQLVAKMFAEGRAMCANPAEKDLLLMGATFDADGDRFFLLVYDPVADGLHILSGDESLALQAEFLIKTAPGKYRGSLFAYTVESDIAVARHAEQLGFKAEVMAVGDKWILKKAMGNPDAFGLGGEETGHSIHAGVISVACQTQKRVFAGNGLKGAINTLVAVHRLAEGKTRAELLTLCQNPFEPGYKHSAYAYYVKKELFHRGSKVWKGVEDIIFGTFAKASDATLNARPSIILDEPDMLYIKLTREGGGQVGAVFVRNSGTEDKISVNVRGEKELEPLLAEISAEAVAYLMEKMKDRAHPMAAAERLILEQLFRGEPVLRDFFPAIDFDRLIYEMEIKQKIIMRKGPHLSLTLLGRKIVE